MAYNLQDAPNLLHSQMEALTIKLTSVMNKETHSIRHHEVEVATNTRDTIFASQLLDNQCWILNVDTYFNSDKIISVAEVSNELKNKADEIQKVMQRRLARHLSCRIADAKI